MIIALDSECNGIDFFHGARPFFITTCDENGEQRWWEWEVDPLDRSVSVPVDDIAEIEELIGDAERIVFHNSSFDIQALSFIGIEDFPWHKVHDTLLASHILASALPHDLTSLGIQYLGKDISRYEEAINECTDAARRKARSLYPDWMIAKEGLACMPSAKEKCWKYDMWLPKLVAQREGYDEDHEWFTSLEEYANHDSWITMSLWPTIEKELKKLDLWDKYEYMLKILPVKSRMKSRGMFVSRSRMTEKKREYLDIVERSSKKCLDIAKRKGYELVLPKSGRNKNLNTFVFDVLKLPILARSEKTGDPSFDSDIRQQYESFLEDGPAKEFIAALNAKSKYDTAISYMNGYERYWLPYTGDHYVLHPDANPTGTATLQWSFSNPNESNISKQSETNLRYSFGPTPGRVWYSADASNIQLRIPAYEAGEKELIEVFDHPDKAPYYGGYHLVIFDLLHPQLFAEKGKNVKLPAKEGGYEDTWYQWVKNGNFARQFGAQEAKCDATYRVRGAYQKIKNRFPKIDELNRQMIAYADRYGYVETIPDKVLGCKRGYPLMTSRSEYGRTIPTIPFCYHIAGSAQWWIRAAMIECDAILEEWRRRDKFHVYIIAQIHDELVFDFPQEKVPGTHKPRIEMLRKAMEGCGKRIGVPTPVNFDRHDIGWDVGVAV